MIVAATMADLRQIRRDLPGPIGFVPTMGSLHEGHLSLVRAARAANRSVVVSIFVNPLQFGPSEDFTSYPRDPERDLQLVTESGVDLVFLPAVAEMYPPGHGAQVDVGPVAKRLEGVSRPGHFRGVATVGSILFNLVQPTRAYFGQKDAQQCVVIKKLVADLAFPIEIVVLPTVREADGLALSSRNVYLSPDERVAAGLLSSSLRRASTAFDRGDRDANALRELVRRQIDAEPLARLEYVSIADGITLDELATIDRPAVVSLAVRFGRTRLIDCAILGEWSR